MRISVPAIVPFPEPAAAGAEVLVLVESVLYQDQQLASNVCRGELAPHDKAAKHRQLMSLAVTRNSQVEMAKDLGVAVRTVKRRMRTLAAFIVLARRHRADGLLQLVLASLRARYQTVEASDFVVKYKYDEMSAWLSQGSKKSYSKQVAKLLQISVTWFALIVITTNNRLHGVILRHKVPSTIRSIERSTVRNMAPALYHQTAFPSCSEPCSYRSRMPIADDHASNGSSDCAMLRALPSDRHQRFRCATHNVNAIADRILRTFRNERRGILHSTLAFSFTGQWERYRENWKLFLKKRLRMCTAITSVKP